MEAILLAMPITLLHMEHSYDGSVVLICTYLEEGSTSTWAHEMGHALEPYLHTFDGDDPDNGRCGDDGISMIRQTHIRTIRNNAFYLLGLWHKLVQIIVI